MLRISNHLIGLLNILTTIISVPIMIWAVYMGIHSHSECDRFIHTPVLAFGAFLFVVSILGLVGSCCRITFFLWIYLFIMFVLIVGLIAFTVFAFVVTNKGAGNTISGRGYKEYRLGDYSGWLQKHVGNERNWMKIKSCLSEVKVCGGLGKGHVYQKAEDFYKRNLTPIQSGCCKPPTSCGFTYKNATYWIPPKSGMTSTETDCTTWNNDQDHLCFDCESCKAGVLANLKHEWRKVAIINISALVLVIAVYCVGCCAFRNNKSENRYKGHSRV